LSVSALLRSMIAVGKGKAWCQRVVGVKEHEIVRQGRMAFKSRGVIKGWLDQCSEDAVRRVKTINEWRETY
jgi:hypothetical protein